MGRSGWSRPSRCTGSARGRWAPTPSDRSDDVSRLKSELSALDREPLTEENGRRSARRRADAFDRAILGLARTPAGPDLAVLAVGGYGSRELAPGSDVDLLFVHPPGADDDGRRAAEAVLYPLWNAGFSVSHAVRTVEECAREAERELRSLTALITLRTVAGGSPALVERLRGSVAQVIDRDRGAFVNRLWRSRENRAGRFGEIPRTLQPDLKESLGGLRDLQILGWLRFALDADVHPNQPELARWLARTGESLDPAEKDLLLRARIALHRTAESNSNVLVAELHDAVAAALGLGDEPGWEARDVLMREVCRAGRWTACVADRALDWAQSMTTALPTGNRVPRAPSPQTPASPPSQDVGWFLVGLAGRMEQGEPAFTQDPVGLAAEVSLLPAVDWSTGVLEPFVRVLAAPGADRALEALDAIGLLARLLPGWSQVRGRPQRDPYHVYPVDAHLMETVAGAGRLLREPDEPFAVAAAGSVDDPAPLLLGALLHDIGKVGKGSHGPIGVEVAGRVLAHMGAAGELRDDVLFLVSEHLLLSDTATRRNLEDEDLVLHVAARIGDERRLALLYLLTIADALATGPTASSPWRLGLVRDLVAKVGHAFERGLMDREQAGRLERAEAKLEEALIGAGVTAKEAEAFIGAVPPGYAVWVPPEEAPVHLGLITPRPEPSEVRTAKRAGRSPGTYRLSVGAVDRLGLLAAVAGSMTLSGLSILGARAFTTEDGLALDVFEVKGTFQDEVGSDRWERFEAILGQAVGGEVNLRERVHSLRAHYRPAAEDIPVAIHVDDEASDFYTVVEVSAPDRLGLLFDLAATFSEQDLDVHVAKVATYGPRVVDVFYVRYSAGEKIGDPARRAALARALTESASER